MNRSCQSVISARSIRFNISSGRSDSAGFQRRPSVSSGFLKIVIENIVGKLDLIERNHVDRSALAIRALWVRSGKVCRSLKATHLPHKRLPRPYSSCRTAQSTAQCSAIVACSDSEIAQLSDNSLSRTFAQPALPAPRKLRLLRRCYRSQIRRSQLTQESI
jgi:hypothetical protein